MLPHEICPVDGEVVHGHGTMDESYLTGEPFRISKGPGATVLSGADQRRRRRSSSAPRSVAADSRYAQIMQVMQEAEQRRPSLRRIGDQLGAWYTPLALGGRGAGLVVRRGDPVRFLSVVVVATPCPLLIAIPVAIIGAISTAARRGVIVKDPAALEQLTLCRTMILDKTGTLTYGRPSLSDELYAPPFTRERGAAAGGGDGAIQPASAGGRRSWRRPTMRGYALPDVEWIREEPGTGLRGQVGGARCWSRAARTPPRGSRLPPAPATGLECVVMVDDRYAATLPVPRRAAGREPRLHRPSGSEARVHARAARVGRSRSGSAAPGGRGGDRRDPRRDVARGEGGDRAAGDGAGQDGVHRRRHQRRAGADGGDGRHRVRPAQRRDVGGRARGDHRLVAVEGRRADAPEPPAPARGAAERDRRHGAERRRHGVRGGRSAVAGRGRGRAGAIDLVAVLNALRTARSPAR